MARNTPPKRGYGRLWPIHFWPIHLCVVVVVVVVGVVVVLEPPPLPPYRSAGSPLRWTALGSFFSSSARIFVPFLSLWVSFRRVLVVFEAPGPSNVHVGILRPRSRPKRAHLRVFQKHHQNSTRRHPSLRGATWWRGATRKGRPSGPTFF